MPSSPSKSANSDDDITFTVSAEETGARLDRVIAGRVSAHSRARVQALIRAGRVLLGNGVQLDPAVAVKAGQDVRLSVPPPEPAKPVAQDIPLTVVYEDADVIVIDKPAGLVVHPSAGHASGTLVNALIAHCGDSLSGIGGVRRPGIVHRLDKDTSGLLVVAKNDAAHAKLSEQFAAHGADGNLVRTYEAVCWGVPSPRRGTIDAALGRSEKNRTKIAVVRGVRGRHAVTHYEVTGTFNDTGGAPIASRIRLTLETGRTHQIRVHLAHTGHPLLGDTVYGAGFASRSRRLSESAQAALMALGRQALHAAELGFKHPRTGRKLKFSSALPADFSALVEALSGEWAVPKRRVR